MAKKPIIGITMGDPAGNGSEISVKALADSSVYERCRPIIIGDANCMEKAVKILGKENEIKIHAVQDVKEAIFEFGTIDVYDMKLVDMKKHMYGKVSKMCGEAAFQYVVKVIDLAMKNEIDATVTNAICKEAINMAGHHYSGHTEIYADYTHTNKYTMMLAHDDLRVVHVSTHVSLRQACDKVKKERVLECIRIANNACKAIGIQEPKIGVAGLNPHCGENGMFGVEEIEEIQPAINEAMEEGINIPEKKPTPPDSIFSKAIGGWYDIVVAMYHDQGHIATKTLDFEKTIAITNGMPILRTSVDHGTAFDIAGQGIVSAVSMIEAIRLAAKYAPNFTGK